MDTNTRSLAPTGAFDRSALSVRPLLLAGLVSLTLYSFLHGALRNLGTAEPSFAGEVVPHVERLTREAIDRRHVGASARYLVLVAALFGVYSLVLRWLNGRTSRRLEAAAFAVGTGFLLAQVTSAVMLSTDVYAYAMYGRILAIYGGDPYIKADGAAYVGDPYLPLSYFLPWPSWYGPLWTLVSAGLALAGGDRVGLTVLLFRGIAMFGTLAAGGLIWACLRIWRPERAAQGLVFFLWNPLVVVETGLSGHNDGFMMGLLLLGVYAALRGRMALSFVGFSLSAMVKFVTGLALPLYLALVLRRLVSWPRRARFLALGGVLSLAVAGGLFGVVGGGARLPVAQSASAVYFYDNNIYQVIFPRLRVWLGEDPEAVRVPAHFYTWWAETRDATVLESAPRPAARNVESVKAGTTLLVTAPLDNRWVKVYNPASKRLGYTPESLLEKIERPEFANHDPSIWDHERNPASGPIAARANSIIRVATWLLFGLLMLAAAWTVRDERSWLVATAAVFLAAYWLVATEIWPWYVIWALAVAALVIDSRPALLAGILSGTVLTLYVTIGFERSGHSWLFTYRSAPAFILPLIVFGCLQLAPRARRLLSRPPVGQETSRPRAAAGA